MLTKTTNNEFQKYGSVYQSPYHNNEYICKKVSLSSHTITTMFYSNKPIRIEAAEFANIVVSKDGIKYEIFAINHNIIIEPFQYFNLIPQIKKQDIKLIIPNNAKFSATVLDKPYVYYPTVPILSISQIIGCYYNIKKTDEHFKDEEHSFYELIYVDQGYLESRIDDTCFPLHSGDLVIYSPHQQHIQKVNNKKCAYLTIVFNMHICDDSKLLNRVFHLNDDLRDLLDKLSLTSNKQNIYDKTLMLCYLQELIIHLLRDSQTENKTLNTMKYQDDLFKQIIKYIDDNITSPLTVEDVTQKFSISRSTLQTLFKTHTNKTPKHYITVLKLNLSKKLLLENKYTVTEIAYMLGFSSIHYFSRAFKQQFNLTPSEYTKHAYQQQGFSLLKNDEK